MGWFGPKCGCCDCGELIKSGPDNANLGAYFTDHGTGTTFLAEHTRVRFRGDPGTVIEYRDDLPQSEIVTVRYAIESGGIGPVRPSQAAGTTAGACSLVLFAPDDAQLVGGYEFWAVRNIPANGQGSHMELFVKRPDGSIYRYPARIVATHPAGLYVDYRGGVIRAYAYLNADTNIRFFKESVGSLPGRRWGFTGRPDTVPDFQACVNVDVTRLSLVQEQRRAGSLVGFERNQKHVVGYCSLSGDPVWDLLTPDTAPLLQRRVGFTYEVSGVPSSLSNVLTSAGVANMTNIAGFNGTFLYPAIDLDHEYNSFIDWGTLTFTRPGLTRTMTYKIAVLPRVLYFPEGSSGGGYGYGTDVQELLRYVGIKHFWHDTYVPGRDRKYPDNVIRKPADHFTGDIYTVSSNIDYDPVDTTDNGDGVWKSGPLSVPGSPAQAVPPWHYGTVEVRHLVV